MADIRESLESLLSSSASVKKGQRSFMPKPWLESFEPSPDPLSNLLRSQIDDHMIREIAAADYGQDLEAHLRPLKAIRDESVGPILDGAPSQMANCVTP